MTSKNTHPHSEQLSAYVDSMLDVSRMRGIGEHLRGCGACRSRENVLRQTKARLRDLPEPALPPTEFWTASYRRLRVSDREKAAQSSPLKQAWHGIGRDGSRRWAAGLAAAAVMASLLAGPLVPEPHSASSPSVMVPAQDVSPDVSSLAELHTESVSRLPLADADRQKMLAADVQQALPESSEAAGDADATD